MTGSQKAAIAGIVVVTLVGAALVVWSAGRSDDPHSRDRSFAESYPLPTGVKMLGSMLGSSGPRIELSQRSIELGPSAPENVVRMTVPRSDEAIRRANIALKRGSGAEIVYKDRTPDAPSDLRVQSMSLPRAVKKGDDRMQGSIVAMREGGALTIVCRGTAACLIEID